MELFPGIYEQVISEYLASKLSDPEREGRVLKDPLARFDPQNVLARHIAKILRNALLSADERRIPLAEQVRICNRLIGHLAAELQDKALERCAITPDAEVLLALAERNPSANPSALRIVAPTRPETSIAQSSLFTGSPGEPGLVDELRKEIRSADRVDLLISFIKWSGLRLILDDLKEFVQRGKLRVITTSYTGATDIKAVEALAALRNTAVRISYDTDRTRLHAKTYTFHRDNGFSTSYIGSSNLSNPAITSGLEWNVKVTEQDSYDIVQRIEKTFETYWKDPEFVEYTPESRERLRRALSKERRSEIDLRPVFDIKPYYYQKEILERLKAERELHNNYKNLIVAATGTGKTVISAFDYKGLIQRAGEYPRLLFVAHREEILKQSIQVFRGVLKDQNFGDLLVGGTEPAQIEHLFTSIQSLNSKNLPKITPPDYYDMIIVDEFHHAAAPSYQRLLTYYTPKVLLGLTATPERMDNLDILEYFNEKISAEIRLPEAINRKLLAPFHYFGVTDVVDLDTVPWKRGTYDPAELSRLYTGNQQRADLIIRAVQDYTTDLHDIIGLGFCVSIEHAEYMAAAFQEAGIPAACLHSGSSREERFTIQKRLVAREIHFIFAVDLYNEGVDIPEVNTILFLRPTESLTVFIQQFGRGLRLSDGKECLTVLDFVGHHNKNFPFGERISALLSPGGRTLVEQVSRDSYSLPKGCYIHFEEKARERVLANIRANITNRATLIRKIRSFEDETGEPLSFKKFLQRYSLQPLDVYRRGTFCSLAAEAGVYPEAYTDERLFPRTAAIRLATLNSPEAIRFIRAVLSDPCHYSPAPLSNREKNMLAIFYYSLNDVSFRDENMGIEEIFSDLFAYDGIRREICDLLEYNGAHIEFLPKPVDLGFENALELHSTYTRAQAFAALGHYTLTRKPAGGSREGVVYLEDKKADVFLVTLNKTEEHYSPTTMYEDYAVNENLFHWQSQSTTSASSPTGQRYIKHEQQESKVLLFVREYNRVDGVTQPYLFLGTARYLSHEGSRPMSITWELDHPMPPGFFLKANKMVVG
ncbi:DEAD/DEAH box helicase [Methanoculleus oceani]|uniref:NgoFVII family restriction endonuclease n=1 Tax=Methanoculleus oceani TaxID=2184756 RepID=A0ABD4TEX1_9EURY|nr:DEAD/DEAH box helicase [Methanoculleus sp. CWC-02]MCM2465439.1 NgoFVII family restriction endonuclease [Methanoculleus sp. CWC-02]